MSLVNVLQALIRERGPLTVAAFMEVALYHHELGYYARAVQRSGRAGDFFTSVDVGPLFGRLLAVQIAEMASLLDGDLHLVEAGAGNGRLSADILSGLEQQAAAVLGRTALHLVEISPTARDAQRDTLGPLATHLASSSATIPDAFEGVLVANELLDAMPVHQLVMREDGLREVFVDLVDGALVTKEGPLSTPRLSEYFEGLGIELEPGWRTEVSLEAVDWVRDFARRLTRGFAIIIDYGHDATQLYSVTHSAGTLTSYSRHRSNGPEAPPRHDPWLQHPGEQDLTAHVDFTSIRRAAEGEGCVTLGFLDQTYFLMALAASRLDALALGERLALKTLMMPGGLGSTMKVLVLGKGVGQVSLTGCPARSRVT